jgi:membrane-associated phospholipid phosphatase
MLRRTLLVPVLGLLFVGTGRAHAEDASDTEPTPQSLAPPPGPFDGLGRHLAGSFLGPGFMLHLVAVAATATMSSQDVDARVHRYFRQHPDFGRAAYPAVIAGVVGPVALFGGLHLAGRVSGDARTIGAAWAVLQSGALTLGYVTLLKLVSGRPAPREDYIPSLAPDDELLSRKFRPGFNRGGVLAGWPSGHVAVTTAVLASLVGYYPDSWLLKLALLVGSTGMALGVSSFEAGGMHWCSDAVAGALMALPIGLSTGKGMRGLVEGAKPHGQSAWFVTPALAGNVTGAALGRWF